MKKKDLNKRIHSDSDLANCLKITRSLMDATEDRHYRLSSPDESKTPGKKDIRKELFKYFTLIRDRGEVTPFFRFASKAALDDSELVITLALLVSFLDNDSRANPTGRFLLKLITDTPEEFMSAAPKISYDSHLSAKSILCPTNLSEHDMFSLRFEIPLGTVEKLLGVKTKLFEVKSKKSPKAPAADTEAPALTPKHIFDKLGKTVIGQVKAREKIAVAVYNHFLRVNDTTGKLANTEKSNILMIGPTGSGKTLLCKTLAEILKLPVAITNATTMTETGYVGGDITDCLADLFRAAKGDLALAQKGIIYIDEIDKIATCQVQGHNTNRDVSGKSVQEELLRVLEPNIIAPLSKHPMDRRNDFPPMDTKNILFIVGGAFAGLDEICAKSVKPKLGFMNSAEAAQKQPDGKPEITTEALIEYGMIPEFLGRLPVLAVLDELKEDELVQIMKNPNRGLLTQYSAQFEVNKIALRFDDEALVAVARRSIEKGLGARGLKKIMEGVLNDHMYNMFGTVQKEVGLIIASDLTGRVEAVAEGPTPIPAEAQQKERIVKIPAVEHFNDAVNSQ